VSRSFKPVPLLYLIIAALLLVFFVDKLVNGDELDHGHGHHDDGDVAVDLLTETGGNSYSSRALGMSHSLGDVDINQCIVTKQKGSFVVSWQNYDYNLWCMGEVFDRMSLHTMAAYMRCDIPPIRAHFTDDQSCWDANTVNSEITISPELADLYSRAARFEDDEEQREQQIAELEHTVMEQQVRFEKWEQRAANYKPPKPDPQIQQALEAAATRRARSREAYDKVIAESQDK